MCWPEVHVNQTKLDLAGRRYADRPRIIKTGLFRRRDISEGHDLGPGRRNTRRLHNCTMEETSGQRRCQVNYHRPTASGLAKDSHIGRISTEGGNVALNPLQGCLLVHMTVIDMELVGSLGSKRGMCEETEAPDAIVHANSDHALAGDAIQWIYRRPTGDQCATIDPDHHGQLAG